jgi:serine/threonine protein kinase
MGSQLKLIDLGVSKSLESTQDLTGSYAGSIPTMAPEIKEE